MKLESKAPLICAACLDLQGKWMQFAALHSQQEQTQIHYTCRERRRSLWEEPGQIWGGSEPDQHSLWTVTLADGALSRWQKWQNTEGEMMLNDWHMRDASWWSSTLNYRAKHSRERLGSEGQTPVALLPLKRPWSVQLTHGYHVHNISPGHSNTLVTA